MFKVASLFSGCGGADLGVIGGFNYLKENYKSLPFDIVYANDIDRKALNTYEENFKDFNHPIVCSDIKEVEASSIPSHDILLGGFPCQSFSTVNPTKDPFDDRANLYKEMIRILKHHQPKFFIAENVKGFMSLKKGVIFKRVSEEFEKAGYILSSKLINAADFGIPQKRERVFIIGVRKDLGKPYTFPIATHDKEENNDLKPWVPLNKVIDSLIPEDPKYYFSERAVQGMKNAKKNMKRGLWQDLNGPCLTITSHLAKVSLNSRDPVLLVDRKNEKYRRFTPREAARIQSFPDNFKFVGSEGDAYRQIGNAIPPVLFWHLTNALNEQFKEHLNSKNEIKKHNKVLV
ncbi:DNA cytosine methyltransferase [Salinicoccus roseus]|uniref:Cytosine-specific methyltransferase n=1 Tax=Salinicoccus roseus TaxID=45670 RepID=A0A0C2HH25_9STAP|nr:DNA (cytosine-5-)-methyltransferase [Salinicoccus roseus]KIH70944.1 DNA methyltransferase [Salinicoccus roseus]MDB0580168.1 DNA (cytosine-5-)-methyltransferase [Salinicoccus roseus]